MKYLRVFSEFATVKKNSKLVTFGKTLKAKRIKAGYTQAELADLIGVDTRTIQKFEAGDANITILNIYALAEALDVDGRDLL